MTLAEWQTIAGSLAFDASASDLDSFNAEIQADIDALKVKVVGSDPRNTTEEDFIAMCDLYMGLRDLKEHVGRRFYRRVER